MRKIEILFMKASLKRSKMEQLKKLYEKYLEAMTDLLMDFQDKIPEGKYLQVSNSMKTNAEYLKSMMNVFGS